MINKKICYKLFLNLEYYLKISIFSKIRYKIITKVVGMDNGYGWYPETYLLCDQRQGHIMWASRRRASLNPITGRQVSRNRWHSRVCRTREASFRREE